MYELKGLEMESFQTFHELTQRLSSEEDFLSGSSDDSADNPYSAISSTPLSSPEESPRDNQDQDTTTVTGSDAINTDENARFESQQFANGPSESPYQAEIENVIPNFPGKLNQRQSLQLQQLQNILFCDQNGRPRNPITVIDARGALSLFYKHPKTLEHHLAGSLLLKWKWQYFAKYNFWYAIFEHPETKKVSACYYNNRKEIIESEELGVFYHDLSKLAAQNLF